MGLEKLRSTFAPPSLHLRFLRGATERGQGHLGGGLAGKIWRDMEGVAEKGWQIERYRAIRFIRLDIAEML